MDGSAMEEHPLLGDVNNNGDDDSRQERGTNDDLEQGEVDSELPISTGTWREWTAKKLEAPSTHKAIIILITIDACCVLADLVYTFLSPERDCSSSRPISPQGPTISNPGASTLIRPIVNLSYVRVTGNEGEEEDDITSSPIWLTVLSHISLTITTLFLLEIPLALWCFGPAYYNPFPSLPRNGKGKDKGRVESGLVNEDEDERAGEGEDDGGGGGRRGHLLERNVRVKRDPNLDPKTGSQSQGHPYPYPYPYAGLHLFDAFVVLTTFILEAILRGREAELAGLLILLRLWRLVKLVGGLAVGAGELQEELSNKLEETERLLHAERARVRHLEDENANLRSRLEGQIGLNKDTLVDTEVLEAV